MPEDNESKVWLDKTQTYSHNGEQYQANPKQILMAMARAQRDGMSLEAIIAEYDLKAEARNPYVLQRALNVGHQLLKEAILSGEEPEESRILVDAYGAPLKVNDPLLDD
jgi:hypothetical protein